MRRAGNAWQQSAAKCGREYILGSACLDQCKKLVTVDSSQHKLAYLDTCQQLVSVVGSQHNLVYLDTCQQLASVDSDQHDTDKDCRDSSASLPPTRPTISTSGIRERRRV